nr:RebD-like chromopyrrolic acid synthase [uncultured bacterium]
MSVLDLPRLHFAGTAVLSLPTGPRFSGLLDQETNTVRTDDGPFPVERPPGEYHDYLMERTARFDAAGRPDPDGPFNSTVGWNLGGSGHFGIDTAVVGVETEPGRLDTSDALVGRAVDMWGHYNPYLATTFNKARVFDVDPAARSTSTLMVGQFSLGRLGRSHEVGYLLTGPVSGYHPPRWHDFRHLPDEHDHPFAPYTRLSVLYQFVVRDDLEFPADPAVSPGLSALRAMLDDGRAGGLVVQFVLSNMATPVVPDRPDRWDLHGTVGPWFPDELATYPAGRLLVPEPGHRSPLRALSLAVQDEHVVLNMANALPRTHRAPRPGPGGTHPVGPPVDAGPLELRTVDGDRLVAVLPPEVYRAADATCGVVTVPRVDGAADSALYLVGEPPTGGRVTMLLEREVNVQSDDASLIVEHPRGPGDTEHDHVLEVRSFVRGHPAAVDGVRVTQFPNPAAFPADPAASVSATTATDLAVAVLSGEPGPGTDPAAGGGAPAPHTTVATDGSGRGRIRVHGTRAGSCRLLLGTTDDPLPSDPDAPGSAAVGHDDGDRLGIWPAAGSVALRILPDDWALERIPQDEVTVEVLYREVFAYYELLFTFMKSDVFSLADDFRVATHPRLIWNMCDPRNKATTYYMPPSRDLTEPKAGLLLKFLRASHAAAQAPVEAAAGRPLERGITSRGGLIAALRQAATAELAVMLQYLYAVYSLPTLGAGRQLVERGAWTPDQLRMVCGDGGETLDGGLRATLLSIAREEMIHFLVINNVLMAIGEPFTVPDVDFGRINGELPIPLDFALEPLGIGTLDRFLAIERPDHHVRGVRRGDLGGVDLRDQRSRYGSLSELYAAIRDGLQRVPDLFLVEPGCGGGEHHLFMRESVNVAHPDYQLEVDDLPSALFAIDFVTEQGEGGVLGPVAASPPADSHYETFLRLYRELMAEQLRSPDAGPWTPAYPVLRNPTVVAGRDGNREPIADETARQVAVLFNRSYFLMVQLMVNHFGRGPNASLRRSDLMNAALEVMTGMMRPLAELLVTLPSGRPGRTAGPTFELEEMPRMEPRTEVAKRALALRFQHLAEACRKCELVPSSVTGTAEYLGGYFGELR